MRLLYKPLIGLAGFILTGLLLLAAWNYSIKGSIERSVLAGVRAAANDTAVAKAESEVAKAQIVYVDRVREYPVYRDRIIAANPGNKPLEELAKRCDQVVLTCEARVQAGDNLADSLRKQVADLKAQKKMSAPRFSGFTEGLYDFVHREPVVRAGAEMHLFGPLSLTAAAETSAGMNDSRQRVLAGLRFNFR